MARIKTIALDDILDAADKVLRTQGVYKFTQDAVAVEAGISKGGLVYSFPTKDSLIKAMLIRKQDELLRRAKEEAKHYGDHPYADLLGYMRAFQKGDNETTQNAANLLTVVIHAPSVLKEARGFFNKHARKFFDAKTESGKKAQLALLALDGLFFAKFFGLKHYTRKEWEEIISDAQRVLIEEP